MLIPSKNRGRKGVWEKSLTSPAASWNPKTKPRCRDKYYWTWLFATTSNGAAATRTWYTSASSGWATVSNNFPARCSTTCYSSEMEFPDKSSLQASISEWLCTLTLELPSLQTLIARLNYSITYYVNKLYFIYFILFWFLFLFLFVDKGRCNNVDSCMIGPWHWFVQSSCRLLKLSLIH